MTFKYWSDGCHKGLLSRHPFHFSQPAKFRPVLIVVSCCGLATEVLVSGGVGWDMGDDNHQINNHQKRPAYSRRGIISWWMIITLILFRWWRLASVGV